MKQIKIVGIIFTLLMLLISINLVSAHPANTVELTYDGDNQQLTVTISHNTDNTNTHYIEKIQVYKNDIILIDEDYTNQPTKNTFTVSFNVSADEGDKLKVKTECSISGVTQDLLTVDSDLDGSNDSINKKDDTTTPSFGFFSLLISVVAMCLLIWHKKNRS